MARSDELGDAWACLANGNAGKALRLGWSAAQGALTQGDSTTLTSVAELADAIASDGPDHLAEEARRLAAYCRASVSGAAGEVESHALLSRLARMIRPRRTCTHCSAPVSGTGRFCSNCGQPQAD